MYHKKKAMQLAYDVCKGHPSKGFVFVTSPFLYYWGDFPTVHQSLGLQLEVCVKPSQRGTSSWVWSFFEKILCSV